MAYNDNIIDQAKILYEVHNDSADVIAFKLNLRSSNVIYNWAKKYGWNRPITKKRTYVKGLKIVKRKSNRIRRDFSGMSDEDIKILRNRYANEYYHNKTKEKKIIKNKKFSDSDALIIEHLLFVKKKLIEYIKDIDLEITCIMKGR